MEPRRDAIYTVKITSPSGVLVSLKDTDYDTAFAACSALLNASKDEELNKALDSCMKSFGFGGYGGDGYSVTIDASMPHEDTGEKQTCGRRMQDLGPWERKEGLDTWILRGKDKCCSFCGSLHPDRVIELVKEHGFGIIDRTDKGYKFYVRQPDVPNASFGGIKYYRQHDTDEFVAAWNALIDEKQAAITAAAARLEGQ